MRGETSNATQFLRSRGILERLSRRSCFLFSTLSGRVVSCPFLQSGFVYARTSSHRRDLEWMDGEQLPRVQLSRHKLPWPDVVWVKTILESYQPLAKGAVPACRFFSLLLSSSSSSSSLSRCFVKMGFRGRTFRLRSIERMNFFYYALVAGNWRYCFPLLFSRR